MQIDHVLVAVSGLTSAVDDFRRAGFKVYYGAREDKAYNAMIYFEDGTFIELVDLTRFPSIIRWLHVLKLTRLFGVMGARVGHYATCGQRILDMALHTSSIALDWQRLRQLMPVSKRYNLKRIDVNGTRLTWQLFAPKNVFLPFVMSAYHPVRLPEPDAYVHPNRVTGLAEVTYCVGDGFSLAYLDALSLMLTIAPAYADDHSATFVLPQYRFTVSSRANHRITLRGANVPINGDGLAQYGISVVAE